MTTYELSHGHVFEPFIWDADAAGLPGKQDDWVGGLIRHPMPDGSTCTASILFDTPRARVYKKHSDGDKCQFWGVTSLDPLDINPSLVCHCGDHGFIREGRWIPCPEEQLV